jgi:bla regulator protein blaR1
MSARDLTQMLVAASENPLAALAVKSTLALLAALLLMSVARRASASLRHLVATATFGALLFLPLAAVLVPPRVVTVAPAAEPQGLAAAPVARPPQTDAPTASASAAALARRIEPVDIAYALYLLGLLGFVAAPLVGIIRLHGVHRRAEVSVAGTRLANEMARREELRAGIEVAVSDELAVPITFGWTHAVILLPTETADWEEQELSRALRHELEHVARGDWAAHIVSRVALALYWPHPIAWRLWRRLRLEAERACDDAVIRSQGQPEPYAEQLVSLARRLRGRGTVPALSMATRSNLGLRVESILDDRRRRAPRTRLASLAVAAAAVACVWTIAPFQVIGAALPASSDSVFAGDDDDDDDSLDVALLEAAQKGELGKMQALLDRGARATAVIPGDGSPLIAASRRGQVTAMEILIGAGADVNRGVHGDGNPLTMAAKGGYLDAVRLLLDRGADIDRGVPGDGNALIMSAGAGQVEVVRFLLDRGASIEEVVPGDENPLIHASEGGQAQVVRLLLDRGANVNARVWADGGPQGRGEWRTPLLMAKRNGHAEVVRILRAAGARE